MKQGVTNIIHTSPGCVLCLLFDHQLFYGRDAAFVVKTRGGDCLVVRASDQPAALHFHYDLSICAEQVEVISFFFGLSGVLLWRDVDEALHFVAEEAGGQRA